MAGLRITGNIFYPSGEIKDEHISASAGIDADKMEHVHRPGTNFDLPIGGTPVTREEIVFVAGATGTIRGFHALLNDTGTATDVDFDLKVNGATVLSAVINITNADSDGLVKDGSFITSPTTLAVDDIVSISLAVTTSTGAQGPYAWLDIVADDAPA